MKDVRDVVDYYDNGGEIDRLSQDPYRLECIRTQELISRHLTSRPLRVADVGGGAGFYAFWLAEMGHEVHLIDISPRNVSAAHRLNENRSSRLASIQIGDARKMSFKDSSVDMVLSLGPLYHLIEREERLRAIRESHRILKKGGLIFCATISRYASVLDGFFRESVRDPEFVTIMQDDLKTGVHRNPTSKDYFTTSYFHTHDEIRQELHEGSFSSIRSYAVEGFGWLLLNMGDFLGDASLRELLLDALRRTESEQSLVGLSAHLLTTGIK